jgi:hypothetical protein
LKIVKGGPRRICGSSQPFAADFVDCVRGNPSVDPGIKQRIDAVALAEALLLPFVRSSLRQRTADA